MSLPDKPSALIRVALADLAKVEADPRYRVEMAEWGFWGGFEDHPCEVCFAGAVMVGTLERRPKFSSEMPFRVSPRDFPDNITNKLYALNDFRAGGVTSALSYLGISRDVRGLNRRVTAYEVDPAAWRADMERIANDLQMVGL